MPIPHRRCTLPAPISTTTRHCLRAIRTLAGLAVAVLALAAIAATVPFAGAVSPTATAHAAAGSKSGPTSNPTATPSKSSGKRNAKGKPNEVSGERKAKGKGKRKAKGKGKRKSKGKRKKPRKPRKPGKPPAPQPRPAPAPAPRQEAAWRPSPYRIAIWFEGEKTHSSTNLGTSRDTATMELTGTVKLAPVGDDLAIVEDHVSGNITSASHEYRKDPSEPGGGWTCGSATYSGSLDAPIPVNAVVGGRVGSGIGITGHSLGRNAFNVAFSGYTCTHPDGHTSTFEPATLDHAIEVSAFQRYIGFPGNLTETGSLLRVNRPQLGAPMHGGGAARHTRTAGNVTETASASYTVELTPCPRTGC